MITIDLRELDRGDLSRLNTWRNDPEVIRLLGANFLFIGAAIDEQWFAGYLSTRASAVRLAIVVSTSNLCIGVVNLTSIHAINRSAEFSIMLGDKDYWSQGAGQQATARILRHGFADVNLHRIHLTVLADNTRARCLYQRFGFREEGVQRDAVYKEGKFCDLVTMSLLKAEFHDDK